MVEIRKELKKSVNGKLRTERRQLVHAQNRDHVTLSYVRTGTSDRPGAGVGLAPSLDPRLSRAPARKESLASFEGFLVGLGISQICNIDNHHYETD